jgi:hypothetical protein
MINDSGVNVFSGINPDDFLNVLKPKPPKILERQEAFDHVVRHLVKQKLPCLRTDDITGTVDTAQFNLKGHFGPMLSFCKPGDFIFLQKTLGYENLRDCRGFVGVYEYICMVDDQRTDSVSQSYIDLYKGLWDFLERRGIDYICLVMLKKLELYALDWTAACMRNQWHLYPDKCMHRILENLHQEMGLIATTFSLKKDVLSFFRP